MEDPDEDDAAGRAPPIFREAFMFRKRLDIGYADILAGLKACLWGRGPPACGRIALSPTSNAQRTLALFSVRTGLDALLSVLRFPKGSTVVVSGITIPQVTSNALGGHLRAS